MTQLRQVQHMAVFVKSSSNKISAGLPGFIITAMHADYLQLKIMKLVLAFHHLSDMIA